MSVLHERPARTFAQDGETLALGVRAAGAGLGLLAAILLLVLLASDASPGDLVLPALAIGGFWLLWLLAHAAGSLVARRHDARGIEALFGGEIWEAWRYQPEEWDAEIERRYDEPEADPADARFGLMVAGGIGLVVGLVLIVLSLTVMPDGAAAFVVPLGVAIPAGLFVVAWAQGPLRDRRMARDRAVARRLPTPAVWFGPTGLYHEVDGFTSLRQLVAVADSSRSCGDIVFTVRERVVYRPGWTSLVDVDVRIRVPAEATDRAAALARRVRRERLGKR